MVKFCIVLVRYKIMKSSIKFDQNSDNCTENVAKTVTQNYCQIYDTCGALYHHALLMVDMTSQLNYVLGL